MTDPEKEVIEYLEDQNNITKWDWNTVVAIKGALSIIYNQEQVIKNYKQEKEEWLELYNDRVSDIVNLEQEIKDLKSDKDIQIVWGGRRYNTEGMILERYVSKNRIRKEIQELEKMKENIEEIDVSRIKFAELILQSLLEE